MTGSSPKFCIVVNRKWNNPKFFSQEPKRIIADSAGEMRLFPSKNAAKNFLRMRYPMDYYESKKKDPSKGKHDFRISFQFVDIYDKDSADLLQSIKHKERIPS